MHFPRFVGPTISPVRLVDFEPDGENNDIVVNEMGALFVCVQLAYVLLCNITNKYAVRPTEIIDTVA